MYKSPLAVKGLKTAILTRDVTIGALIVTMFNQCYMRMRMQSS